MLDSAFTDSSLTALVYFGDTNPQASPENVDRDGAASSAQLAKRIVDVVVAVLGLVALSPLFLVVALAVRLESPGPVFFRQRRGGLNGRAFRIWKFRTMRAVEDGPNVVQATRDDARITGMGRILRRTSIDELPQLLNVLCGEMSLIGPRPHALAHDEEYGALIRDYGRRFQVKPGLTGWAQVNGSRGETAHLADMQNRIDLDIWYVENTNFLLDIRIFVQTFSALTTQNAAH